MNSAQKKTLAAIFSNPAPKNLEWAKVEALLAACGCRITEGAGSRVRISKGKNVLNAHRPHPGKEAKLYQVRDARGFLEKIGVNSDEEGA